ncbi:hypothetical protein SJ358_28915, partial [Enterobacter hormaechei]|nr:hypothetical protein [Enterobacter hormaechei]
PLLNDLIYFLILLSVFFINFIFTSIAIADYAPRIQDINTGYMIKLASNSPIALNPVKGTDVPTSAMVWPLPTTIREFIG